MKLGKKVVVLGIVVLLCSLSIGMMVQAKPDRTEINFEFNWFTLGTPKKEWMTNSGIYQVRMTPHDGSILSSSVDIWGDLYYIGNLIIFDLATFEAKGGGYIEFTGSYNEFPAGFTGRMNFVIENFYITGTLNLHGSGSLDGMHLKGTMEGPLGGPYFAYLLIWS